MNDYKVVEFHEAFKALKNNDSVAISRLSWISQNGYIRELILKDNLVFMKIMDSNRNVLLLFKWQFSQEDILAKDWYIISLINTNYINYDYDKYTQLPDGIETGDWEFSDNWWVEY